MVFKPIYLTLEWVPDKYYNKVQKQNIEEGRLDSCLYYKVRKLNMEQFLKRFLVWVVQFLFKKRRDK